MEITIGTARLFKPFGPVIPKLRRMETRGEPNGTGRAVVLRRLAGPSGGELLRGQFRDFSFARHAHDRCCISVVTDGALRVDQPGRSDLATTGRLLLFNADRVHWGGGIERAGWSIRTFYVPHESLAALARDLDARPRGTIGFTEPTADDRTLHGAFALAHAHFDPGTANDPLASECRLLDTVATILQRHADQPVPDTAPGREPRAVAQARAYLEAHFERNVTLSELSQAAGMSPFRLARSFTGHLGMPPHAYLTHVRVRRATEKLRAGSAPAEVAAACGFADQSHLNRTFKRHTGFTPGQFRAA